MSDRKMTRIRFMRLGITLVFFFCLIMTGQTFRASAAELMNRRIELDSAFPSASTVHRFSFNTQTGSNIGTIVFEYCSNSPLMTDPCVAPTGLDTSAASVTQTGIVGFTTGAGSTNNKRVLTRAPAFAGPTAVTYTFAGVINPSSVQTTLFVRMYTYDGSNETGSIIDDGAVAFSTVDPYSLSVFVPPYMIFCVGVTVALDCSDSQGNLVGFGEFTPSRTSTATTQFSVSTNDQEGYNVFASGGTMTAGNNVIPSLNARTASTIGTSQFGINLRQNTVPSVGAEPQSGAYASGAPDTEYNSPNSFRYVNGDRVAASNIATGFNRYTVSYIVNVASDQAPGVYSTTLIYTAVASF